MSYGIEFTGTDAVNSLVSLATIGAINTLLLVVIGASLGVRAIQVLAGLLER